MSRRRRRASSSSGRLAGIVGVLVFFVFLGFLGYYLVRATINEVQRDDAMCRIDEVFPRDTVILLDSTDSLNESQFLSVKNYVEKNVLEPSILDERFTVYVLNDQPDTFKFKPVVRVCRPRDGKNADPLTENPRIIKRNWDEKFIEPLLGPFTDLRANQQANSSPIMEMLKFVGHRTMTMSDAPEKRIIIVSDMVEHTSNYSQYRQSKIPFADLKNKPYFREMQPYLEGVDIEVLGIERPQLNHIQNTDHIRNFWEPFFAHAGGRLVRYKRVN